MHAHMFFIFAIHQDNKNILKTHYVTQVLGDEKLLLITSMKLES